MRARGVLSIALLLSLLAIAGCSKPRGGLSGKVTLEGEPLPYGQVTAFDDKGEVVGTSLVLSGEYEISNISPGAFTLTVVTHQPGGVPIGLTASGRDQDPRASQGAVLQEIENRPESVRNAIRNIKPVPLKYTSPKESGLKSTVVKGNTTFNIEMAGKGAIPPAPPAPRPR